MMNPMFQTQFDVISMERDLRLQRNARVQLLRGTREPAAPGRVTAIRETPHVRRFATAAAALVLSVLVAAGAAVASAPRPSATSGHAGVVGDTCPAAVRGSHAVAC